ncbi:hypothetical protein QUF74_13075 [Candidatus Halobeggiatoa sp. HSG11]|nr:hypothetical protein [Candidatus Halobeggiatoa sp. HSG11]
MSGFNIGNVGGNVSMDAGGDIVGGDKNTTTTTTTITIGFKQDQDKQKFVGQIEELRKQLRQVKSDIEDVDGIDEDDKDAIIMELMQQVKALKTAKDMAEELPTKQEPSQEKRDAIEAPLNGVDGVVKKVTEMFNKAADIGDKVRKVNNLKLILPILISARHLFGLP